MPLQLIAVAKTASHRHQQMDANPGSTICATSI